MKVVIDKVLVNYQDEGSGPVLVLLHGWGASLHTYDNLAAHLVKKFRVIRLDFPGFGQSTLPPEDWGVDGYAQLIIRFLQKLDVFQVRAVLAHSFGGRVTIKLVARYGFCPETIVLMGSAGIKPDVTSGRAIIKTAAKAGKLVTNLPGIRRTQEVLRRRVYNAIGSSDYLEAGPLRQVFLSVINEDLTREIPAITQHCLLLWGEQDHETPIRDAEKIHQLIKGSQLVIIPGAGHFVYMDAPDITEKEIDKVLA